MKHISRIFALCMVLVLCVGILPMAFAATTPDATIDFSRSGSLSLYKYDITTANSDGAWDSESYVSTGKQDSAVEQALNPYAIQGVEFTYLNVASISTFSGVVNGESITKVLYGVRGLDQNMAFLTAIGLSSDDCYAPATKNIRGIPYYYFESDTIINALNFSLAANATATKNALEAVVAAQNGTAMPETDAYGHTGANDLPLGLYLIVETRVPENVTNTTAPFFASVPTTTIDGKEWNYDLTLYPKNEAGNPTLEKTLREAKTDTGKNNGSQTITDGFAHTGTASDGDVIEYQIISKLPVITSKASYLTTYTFVDTLSKGITYNKGDLKLEWFTDAACTEKVATWTLTDATAKFSVSYADGENDVEVMTVAMTADGLAEINGTKAVYGSNSLYSGYSECYVRMTYAATVNSDASVTYGDSGNPNEVTLEWRRTNTAYYDTLRDCCHLYTYAIDLTKKFSDNAGDFVKVNFTVYNETDGYWLKAELDEDGVYYVTDHVSTEDEATIFVPAAADGKLTIWGVEDDEYTVTEVQTADGYTLLRDPISIVITSAESNTVCEVCGAKLLTASATVNDNPVTMTADHGSVNALVPLTVTNTRGPELPKTGDTGVWRYAAYGILLVLIAACFIVALLLKRKKNPQGKK